jgi:DNA polymerase V
MPEKCYIAIDLKSFYASVECVDRKLDPLDACLVVADLSRTDKTICLAVSPALKHWGVPGRPRLFEVQQQAALINDQRLRRAPYHRFRMRSTSAKELDADPSLELDFLVATPRMGRYMEISSKVYDIYLHYIAPDDIHVYSIDEVFLDATNYLTKYHLTAQELARKLIHAVLEATGITATAGIGENLFLCKVAMDIVAKHIPPDQYGVRVAEMSVQDFRESLWTHQPLTDFWRVGPGTADKLKRYGMRTLGDVARMSTKNQELLYRLFGVNAELLIDHAWGLESCTLQDIKSYRSAGKSLGSGQVLQEPYDFSHAELVVREMGDQLALSLVKHGYVTDQLVLWVGYDAASLKDSQSQYTGDIRQDRYGRDIPTGAHGSIRFSTRISSSKILTQAAGELFRKIANPRLLVRRLSIAAGRVFPAQAPPPKQPELFTLPEEEETTQALQRERRQQQAVLAIQQKLGKNAILKAMNLEEGATTRTRNTQVGGHRV